MTASDGQREQLAQTLFEASQAQDFYQVAWENNSARSGWYEYADALLPVVQRIADRRAAQVLREAAHWADIHTDEGGGWLRVHADALDPVSPT